MEDTPCLPPISPPRTRSAQIPRGVWGHFKVGGSLGPGPLGIHACAVGPGRAGKLSPPLLGIRGS